MAGSQFPCTNTISYNRNSSFAENKSCCVCDFHSLRKLCICNSALEWELWEIELQKLPLSLSHQVSSSPRCADFQWWVKAWVLGEGSYSHGSSGNIVFSQSGGEWGWTVTPQEQCWPNPLSFCKSLAEEMKIQAISCQKLFQAVMALLRLQRYELNL